jgi:hypothetical protein
MVRVCNSITVLFVVHMIGLTNVSHLKDWGFGVTSDISGTLENVDSNVLFDFFIFIHEVGHSLGSGHTFDEEYNPPVDACEPCAIPGSNATVDGLPRNNAGTIMASLS